MGKHRFNFYSHEIQTISFVCYSIFFLSSFYSPKIAKKAMYTTAAVQKRVTEGRMRKNTSSRSRLSTILKMVHGTVINMSVCSITIPYSLNQFPLYSFMHCLFPLNSSCRVFLPSVEFKFYCLVFFPFENKKYLFYYSAIFFLFFLKCVLAINSQTRYNIQSRFRFGNWSSYRHRYRRNFIGVVQLGFIFNLSNMFQCKSSPSWLTSSSSTTPSSTF